MEQRVFAGAWTLLSLFRFSYLVSCVARMAAHSPNSRSPRRSLLPARTPLCHSFSFITYCYTMRCGQVHYTDSSVKTMDVWGYGKGSRVVYFTTGFYISVINNLLVNPNMRAVGAIVRNGYMSQWQAVQARHQVELAANLVWEECDVRSDEDVAEFTCYIRKHPCHTTLGALFLHWWHTQGIRQHAIDQISIFLLTHSHTITQCHSIPPLLLIKIQKMKKKRATSVRIRSNDNTMCVLVNRIIEYGEHANEYR
jgi:hypothetical protein